jgi:hypothetical protein
MVMVVALTPVATLAREAQTAMRSHGNFSPHNEDGVTAVHRPAAAAGLIPV